VATRLGAAFRQPSDGHRGRRSGCAGRCRRQRQRNPDSISQADVAPRTVIAGHPGMGTSSARHGGVQPVAGRSSGARSSSCSAGGRPVADGALGPTAVARGSMVEGGSRVAGGSMVEGGSMGAGCAGRCGRRGLNDGLRRRWLRTCVRGGHRGDRYDRNHDCQSNDREPPPSGPGLVTPAEGPGVEGPLAFRTDVVQGDDQPRPMQIGQQCRLHVDIERAIRIFVSTTNEVVRRDRAAHALDNRLSMCALQYRNHVLSSALPIPA